MSHYNYNPDPCDIYIYIYIYTYSYIKKLQITRCLLPKGSLTRESLRKIKLFIKSFGHFFLILIFFTLFYNVLWDLGKLCHFSDRCNAVRCSSGYGKHYRHLLNKCKPIISYCSLTYMTIQEGLHEHFTGNSKLRTKGFLAVFDIILVDTLSYLNISIQTCFYTNIIKFSCLLCNKLLCM